MWIKVCGLTSTEALDAALEARVDAVGFVLTPSVRLISPRAAGALAARVRGRVQCCAVMYRPSQALIDEVLRDLKPDVVQADAEDLEALDLPESLARLPVYRAGAPVPRQMPSRILFEGPRSGAGQTVDWTEAAALARRASMVLAGGLTPANVAAAIAAVRPDGVDVSSGVEVRPGVKSADLIARFVATARAVS